MRTRANSNAAFTLVEIMIVVVLLSILAAITIPRFADARERAEEVAEAKIVKSVRTAIDAYRTHQITGTGGALFPEKLDDAPANSSAGPGNPFFSLVMGVPLTSGWSKGGTIHTYVSPAGNEFIYAPDTGKFE